MKNNQYLVIGDVLATAPLQFEGLEVDTHVDMTVVRVGSNYSIDSSTFGEQPIYVLTAFGHQVKLDKDANGAFRARLEKAIEARAIEMASNTADHKWEADVEAL